MPQSPAVNAPEQAAQEEALSAAGAPALQGATNGRIDSIEGFEGKSVMDSSLSRKKDSIMMGTMAQNKGQFMREATNFNEANKTIIASTGGLSTDEDVIAFGQDDAMEIQDQAVAAKQSGKGEVVPEPDSIFMLLLALLVLVGGLFLVKNKRLVSNPE